MSNIYSSFFDTLSSIMDSEEEFSSSVFDQMFGLNNTPIKMEKNEYDIESLLKGHYSTSSFEFKKPDRSKAEFNENYFN